MEIENKEGAVSIAAIEAHRDDPEANPDPSGQEASGTTPAAEAAQAEPGEKISEAAPGAPAESADLPEESGYPEEQKGAAEEGDKQGKSKETRRDRRINRLTREKREAEERAIAAEEKLAARPEETPAGAEKTAPADKPKQEDFDDFDEYLDARDVYNKKDWQAERDFTLFQADELEKQTARAKRWDEGSKQLRADNPDYDETVTNSDWPVTQAMSDALQSLEQGPAVFFHLCQNEDLAEEIGAMGPVEATLAIGKIASTIAIPAAPAATSLKNNRTKPVSRAPAPGKTVGSQASLGKNPSEMTPKEYEQHRLAGRNYAEL